MQLGMIGLGRMGGNMARRLVKHGHQVVAYARDAKAREAIKGDGATSASTPEELVKLLKPPRVVWLMVPDKVVDQVIADVAQHLQRGDILIDGGNSNFNDDVRRAKELEPKGIEYVDVGTSGGVWGLERGYCLMAGGNKGAVETLDPILAALAPGIQAAPRLLEGPERPSERGYLYCGSHGAGHFTKMVHNAIEYGMMAAYAEGFNVMQKSTYNFNLAETAELWRRGSVVSSWLLDLTARALSESPTLDGFEGKVGDSGEGRWTAVTAIDAGVPIPVIAASLFSRFSSRGGDEFANRLLSAMRAQFGGHVEPK